MEGGTEENLYYLQLVLIILESISNIEDLLSNPSKKQDFGKQNTEILLNSLYYESENYLLMFLNVIA